MKTEKITPAELFIKPRRYLVPIFQRGYVWTLPIQIKPLWRDIAYQSSRILEAQPRKETYKRTHFMGAVVLKPAESRSRYTPASDVIDGQQRITTLQLFLVALRDVLKVVDDKYLTARLEQLTNNPEPNPHPDERFKVWPTSAFRDEVRNIFDAGSAAEVRRRFPLQKLKRKWLPRPLLAQGYLFFYTAIYRYVRGHDFEEPIDDRDELDELIASLQFENLGSDVDKPVIAERADALLDAVSNRLQLIEITLEGDDDAQVIFETLNARGAPLQAADLVRNFVFLYATRRNDDPQELYENYWKVFDEERAISALTITGKFWKDEERQGRLKRPRLDLFLFHYVTQRLRAEFTIVTLFDQFREWWESSREDRDAAIELKVLTDSAKVFKALIVADRTTAFGQIAHRFRILDTTTVYPLILFLASKVSTLDDPILLQNLRDLESYLIRRMVCGLTPKAYNRTFLTLLRKLSSELGPLTATSVRSELVEPKGETVEWPNDDRLLVGWYAAPAYTRLKPARVAMILEAIELSMDTTKQELRTAFEPGRQPTVEHVWPQHGQPAHWPVGMLHAASEVSPANAVAIRIDIQTWGNLTLLTQPLNSSIGNGAYETKRAEIIDKSVLRLNRYFATSAATQWGQVQIHARGAVLLEKFISLWPGP